MNAQQILDSVKVALAAILSFLLTALGGWDSALHLILVLILFDIISGTFKGYIKHDISSRVLFIGALRKIMILICLMIATRVDMVIEEYTSADLFISIRLFTILYFSIEELISIFENLTVCGVKLPKFLESSLRIIDNATNSSPSKVIDILKKVKVGNLSDILTEPTPSQENRVDEGCIDENSLEKPSNNIEKDTEN